MAWNTDFICVGVWTVLGDFMPVKLSIGGSRLIRMRAAVCQTPQAIHCRSRSRTAAFASRVRW